MATKESSFFNQPGGPGGGETFDKKKRERTGEKEERKGRKEEEKGK